MRVLIVLEQLNNCYPNTEHVFPRMVCFNADVVTGGAQLIQVRLGDIIPPLMKFNYFDKRPQKLQPTGIQ